MGSVIVLKPQRRVKPKMAKQSSEPCRQRIIGKPLRRRRYARGDLALHSEFLPVNAGRYASVSLKKAAKERDILITDGITDLVHGAVVAFEQALGGSNPQFLQVD